MEVGEYLKWSVIKLEGATQSEHFGGQNCVGGKKRGTKKSGYVRQCFFGYMA